MLTAVPLTDPAVPLAFPVRAAVMVPALKFPDPSLITAALAVFALAIATSVGTADPPVTLAFTVLAAIVACIALVTALAAMVAT